MRGVSVKASTRRRIDAALAVRRAAEVDSALPLGGP